MSAFLVTPALAESLQFRSGGTVYERPAPTPTPAPAVVASVPAVAPAAAAGPHEGASAAHKKGTKRKALASTDLKPAPTRTASSTTIVPQAGPIEHAAPTIKDLVAKHARENGVPENLASAVVRIESRFNPKARGGSALGLMQIKYDTARSMGYAGGMTALFVPDTNLHFGMKVLAEAYKASQGDLCMTLARYQSGHRVTRVSAANRSYCARAKTYMAHS